MKSHLRFAALAGSLLLALAACGKNEGETGGGPGGRRGPQGTPEAGFVIVQRQNVPLVTELAGRTAAFETSEVRPQVSGVIRSRLFTEGSIVRQGQTLYQIDPSLYRAAAAQARANLASAVASRNAAQIRADRYAPLARMEAVSQQEYTDARAQAAAAARR